MYGHWPNGIFTKGSVCKLLTVIMMDQALELREQTREAMRFWVESEQRSFRCTEDGELVPDDDALDPCADCLRCKRRKFLGHRYPGHNNPHMDGEHDGHAHAEDHTDNEHSEHEHQHDGENGHSHDEWGDVQ
jgi:hypothetical protein